MLIALHPRRRETAGDPYLKSDRGWTLCSTGPERRCVRQRRLLVGKRVFGMAYGIEHSSGFTWIAHGRKERLNLGRYTAGNGTGGEEEMVRGSVWSCLFLPYMVVSGGGRVRARKYPDLVRLCVYNTLLSL